MKPDGGTAFPAQWIDFDSQGDRVVRESYFGMSLRDYFASAALQGLLSRDSMILDKRGMEMNVSNQFSEAAYEFADAMLAERGKQP